MIVDAARRGVSRDENGRDGASSARHQEPREYDADTHELKRHLDYGIAAVNPAGQKYRRRRNHRYNAALDATRLPTP